LNKIKNVQNFAFCAIPQVMAMATLSLCYNNPEVFAQKVKIRRGESARIAVSVSDTNDVRGVHALFYEYAQILADKISSDDPNAAKYV
jgi:farnesyl-diphosphate farnesyltransferase